MEPFLGSKLIWCFYRPSIIIKSVFFRVFVSVCMAFVLVLFIPKIYALLGIQFFLSYTIRIFTNGLITSETKDLDWPEMVLFAVKIKYLRFCSVFFYLRLMLKSIFNNIRIFIATSNFIHNIVHIFKLNDIYVYSDRDERFIKRFWRY